MSLFLTMNWSLLESLVLSISPGRRVWMARLGLGFVRQPGLLETPPSHSEWFCFADSKEKTDQSKDQMVEQ